MKLTYAAAAAAFFTIAGAAHAQSSLTLYGRIDPTVGKRIGNSSVAMQNGTGSRLGFRGEESLGGGVSVFFTMEHRFNVNNGAVTETGHFFRQSYLGLKSNTWGRILLGRDFTAGYWEAMVTADPWGNATAANFTPIVTGGSISQVRQDSQIKYSNSFGPITASAGITINKNTSGPNPTPYAHRPVSAGLTYLNGPLRLSYGYENPGNAKDFWHAVMASYTMGAFNLRGFYGTGHDTTGAKRKSYMLSGSYQVTPAGRILLGYGHLKQAGATGTMNSRWGLGYYHALSKRTTLYANVAYDSKAPTEKSGYDIGLRHSF